VNKIPLKLVKEIFFRIEQWKYCSIKVFEMIKIGQIKEKRRNILNRLSRFQLGYLGGVIRGRRDEWTESTLRGL